MTASEGPTAAQGFFDSLRQAFAAAEAAGGESPERHFRIAGRVVALRFAGTAPVEPFTGALAHLESAPVAEPELTVCVFDTAGTGVPPPPSPWPREAIREAGVVEAFSDARFHTVVQIAVGLLSMLDRERRLAVCWVRDAGALPMPERAAPLRRLLQAWLVDLGLAVVHAGAVGRPAGGVLLAGGEGTGKSTAALACLDSPLRYAGDDYCVLETGAPPRAHSLYATGKTHAGDIPRLPFLAPMVGNREALAHEKAVYDLHRHVPDRLIADFAIRAVLVPRVTTARDTTLVPASSGAVVRALAPTSVLLAPRAARVTLAAISALAREVPGYELRLGADPRVVPGAIAALLDQLGDLPVAVPADAVA